ncbi:MAG: hypothetical protein WEE69_08310 [Acidimicrobiia bacterium]
MSDHVRDLLHGAVPPPKRRIDVGATAAIAHARLRRRRFTIRAGAIAAVVVLAGVGVSAAFGGDDGRRVEIAAGSQASNADAAVTVELLDGWQQLPLVERAMSPGEVLVVGTAERPAGEPMQACAIDEHTPSTRSAYVTLYEYRPGDALNMVGDLGTYSPESFQIRPDDFTNANMPASGDCPNVPLETLFAAQTPLTSATTTPDSVPDNTAPTTSTSLTLPPITGPDAAPVNHFRQITFTDGDRMFLARIISVQDPSEELLAQGFAVLNSLVINAVEAPTTTTMAPGFDEEAAEQQIVDAINASMGTPSPTPSELSVEGGHPFADPVAAEAAAEKAKSSDPLTRSSYEGSLEGKLVAHINWIEFDSPTYARLNFDVFNDGELATANTTGYAVFEDGFWRIGRGTFCEIAARGGVNCPA